MSATSAPPSTTGCGRGSMAAASSFGSTTPTASGRARSMPRGYARISPGSASPRTRSIASRRRFDRYEAAFERLRAAGRVYPAYETRAGARPQAQGPAQPRQAAGLRPRRAARSSEAERARLEAEGRRPHWRFRLDHDAPIEWDDLIRGRQHFEPALLSDPVIRREDGSWLYMLPSSVDDIDMGVTHVAARRGPCHQHRAPDPDVRGAGRDAARLRPRGLAGRIGGQAVEAARLARRRRAARSRGSSRSPWSPSSPGSAPACRSSR